MSELSGSLVPLVWHMRRIWPPSSNILDDAMRHNLSYIINVTPQILLSLLIYWVVPKATVFQRSPVPLVVFTPFGMVCYSCITFSLWLERGQSDARRLKTVVTGLSYYVIWFISWVRGCFIESGIAVVKHTHGWWGSRIRVGARHCETRSFGSCKQKRNRELREVYTRKEKPQKRKKK